MQLLDGKTLATQILADVKQKVATLPDQPGLAVILVGDNPASVAYVKQKRLAAEMVGIDFCELNFPETVTTEELLLEIAGLNHRTRATGVFVQLPLPVHVDKNVILKAISPEKDVDGFHPDNLGEVFLNFKNALEPATPMGILRLLRHYKIPLEGKNVVVVGHSNIVGKPLATMLVNQNATVTVCHAFTKNLSEHTKKADILISATGVPHLVKAPMVKAGVVVIDVGGVKVKDKLVGDVDFEKVKTKVSFITPVPGGVGPMTVASLMENVLECYRRQHLRRVTDIFADKDAPKKSSDKPNLNFNKKCSEGKK